MNIENVTKDINRNVKLANSETGPDAIQVIDDISIRRLKKCIMSYWPKNKNEYFPGPQPVSLERRDIFKLKKFPYVVTVKSDGMRFMMYCTIFDDKKMCYMIDRAFRFYEIEQDFDDDIYQNTLFDGELVKISDGDKYKWTYIIHDCVCSNNVLCSHKDFFTRYDNVRDVLTKQWKEGKDCIPLKPKQFVLLEEFINLVNDVRNEKVGHPTDGYIFTPISIPIGTGAQYSLFKWKPTELHTFDFKINKNENVYTAMVNKKGSLTPFASVSEDTEIGKTFSSQLMKIDDPPYSNGAIVECKFDTEKKCFYPLFIRTDKVHPNGIHTVEKTLINIEENITLEELVNLKIYSE